MTFLFRRAVGGGLLLAMFGLFSLGTVAVGNESGEAVAKGKDALTSHRNLPWYDKEADSLRPIDLSVSSQQNYDWVWELFRILGWIALALLLCGLAYVLILAFLRREVGHSIVRAEHTAGTHVLSPESIEALPVGTEMPISDLLAAARKCYQQGDFQRAIVLLFSHQLVQLDKHQLLRLAKGKTNRQYLREIRRQGPSDGLAPLVEHTMLLFERAFFGRHTPSREQFESCWTQIDDFDAMLVQRAEATA